MANPIGFRQSRFQKGVFHSLVSSMGIASVTQTEYFLLMVSTKAFRSNSLCSTLPFLFVGNLLLFWIWSCAATPIKLECSEQRFRLDNEDLSEDQRRFAEEALNDCETRLQSAQAKDSTMIENLNHRFTPGDTL